ncbi:U32 family peptidase [bacterium D16-51]|nr:U32 family peptidase [bacterium D16-59]RKI62641.1 U32 family peptidase [bacterium D16-51]
MKKKPEILSPAGSVDGMKAAVAAGCDAVYIGGSSFGARAYAGNPGKKELLEAIDFCHLHNVKLYMTVNTLLKEQEIEKELFSFLQPYYEAGLDAVIVQDVGVLRFISRHFPSLPIHASTQMTLTMGKGAKGLTQYHVTRIVPARELTLGELCQMRRDTGLEMEVFVHGALCYCYSGQCLFSSMFGGRSGNRGRCTQPCRMLYYPGEGGEDRRQIEGRYLLSPKELCCLPHLPELIEAGVDSFKIEGRMKRAEYTAFVTAVYRKYVDYYYKLGKRGYKEYLSGHQKEWQEDMRCLAELYNRNGFTQGYLEGLSGDITRRSQAKKGEMLATLRPNHGGVYIGKVISAGKREVTYLAEKNLSAQDVVEFRDSRQKPSYEYTLGKDALAGQKITSLYKKGCKIQVGDSVYRTKDARLLAEIREKYLEKRVQSAVFGELFAEEGKELRLRLEKRDAAKCISIECFGGFCEKAEKRPAAEEDVKKILNQTGNSSFYFEELTVKLTGSLFLPVGLLKKLRRQAFGLLEEEIVRRYRRKDTCMQEKQEITVQQREGHSLAIAASVMDKGQLSAVLGCPAVRVVYLQTERMEAKEIKEAYEEVRVANKSPWLVLPTVFRAPVWRLFEKEWEREGGIFTLSWDGYLARNMESLQFLTEIAGADRTKIRLDHNMYVMNQEAYSFWEEQGIWKLTVPLEASWEEIKEFPFLGQMECIVYGKIPLMVTAQCLRADKEGCVCHDRKGKVSPVFFQNGKGIEFLSVNYCKYCYNVVYQKEPLFLENREGWWEKSGISSIRYAFTTESKEETADILAGRMRGKTQTGHFGRGIE